MKPLRPCLSTADVLFVREFRPLSRHSFSSHLFHLIAQRKDYMMVETRPVGLLLYFWVAFVVLVLFSTIRLFFLPSTMTWAPCPHGVRTRGKKSFCSFFSVSRSETEDIRYCTWLRPKQPCTRRPSCGGRTSSDPGASRTGCTLQASQKCTRCKASKL